MGLVKITTPVTSAVTRDNAERRALRENEGHGCRARRLLPAAQELAVTRPHEDETALHQANGPIT